VSQSETIAPASSEEPGAIAARPQHLLLTLLGDYWYPRSDELPSTALVALLGEFGVSEANARAALSRLSRRGLLASRRDGRRTSYWLTPAGLRVLREGTLRIFTFGTRPREWDGRWTVVAFSIPEDNRGLRSTLRTRLAWLGFAAPFDALWMSPGDREGEAAALLAELAVHTATIVVGKVSQLAPLDPARAWDLDGLAASYAAFASRFARVAARVAAGDLAPAEALIHRTAVIDVWRNFPAVDPELPDGLLPRGWPREQARATFTAIYDGLGQAAARRVADVFSTCSPDQSSKVSFHTSANALDLAPD
jgi:phenylacetic acid degradation operon negative regulatory protein